MSALTESLRSRKGDVGEVTLTDWAVLDQTHVDAFAGLISNFDPMHNQPARADELGLFGGRTVVHGFFTLALITKFLKEVPHGLYYSTESAHTINYGLDRVRWVAPTFVGVPIRARIVLSDVIEKKPGMFKMTYDVSIEQEGHEQPRMVATSHMLIVLTE